MPEYNRWSTEIMNVVHEAMEMAPLKAVLENFHPEGHVQNHPWTLRRKRYTALEPRRELCATQPVPDKGWLNTGCNLLAIIPVSITTPGVPATFKAFEDIWPHQNILLDDYEIFSLIPESAKRFPVLEITICHIDKLCRIGKCPYGLGVINGVKITDPHVL